MLSRKFLTVKIVSKMFLSKFEMEVTEKFNLPILWLYIARVCRHSQVCSCIYIYILPRYVSIDNTCLNMGNALCE